jgi:hypothetical protein
MGFQPRSPEQAARIRRITILAGGSVAGLLSTAAILPFGLHLLEHGTPLGVWSGPASASFPEWAGRVLIYLAVHCVAPTWIAVGVVVGTVIVGRPRWPVATALFVLAASALISMRDLTAILHSCWGEAPHFPWCLFICR